MERRRSCPKSHLSDSVRRQSAFERSEVDLENLLPNVCEAPSYVSTRIIREEAVLSYAQEKRAYAVENEEPVQHSLDRSERAHPRRVEGV